jgi:membrane protease YdiL (CAAX protease family)
MGDQRDRPTDITAIALAFEGGLGLLALALGWWLEQWPLPGVEVGATSWSDVARPALWGVLGTLPMLAGMWLADRFAFGPLRQLKQDFERLIVPLFAHCSVLEMALISLMAGIGEEMLFRGLIQAGLADWLGPPLGPWIALVLASIVFGFGHMISAAYAVVAMVIGVYLGWLLLATESIVTPAIAHGLYDFCALLYLVRFRSRKI